MKQQNSCNNNNDKQTNKPKNIGDTSCCTSINLWSGSCDIIAISFVQRGKTQTSSSLIKNVKTEILNLQVKWHSSIFVKQFFRRQYEAVPYVYMCMCAIFFRHTSICTILVYSCADTIIIIIALISYLIEVNSNLKAFAIHIGFFYFVCLIFICFYCYWFDRLIWIATWIECIKMIMNCEIYENKFVACIDEVFFIFNTMKFYFLSSKFLCSSNGFNFTNGFCCFFFLRCLFIQLKCQFKFFSWDEKFRNVKF